MGGKALKNIETRRYLANEYFKISASAVVSLITHDNICGCGIIESYREKESFGDSDILYTTYDDIPLDVNVFKAIFKPDEIIRNGEVTSLNIEQLQVDFIHSPMHSADYAKSYFANNDLGNLSGKVFHSLGLKHGHRGLFLPLRDGDNKFDSIELTVDHDKALEFVGLSSEQFRSGFDNLDQIFKFVSSSPYFNHTAYAYENLTAVGRIRDKKRDTYKKFVEYCASYPSPSYVPSKDKSVYLKMIFEFFPDAYEKYQNAMTRLAAQKFVKEKFNGNVVSELTGLKDKELGQFMQVLKSNWYFSQENIIYLTSDQLKNHVLQLYQEHTK